MSKQSTYDQIKILGVGVDALSLNQAIKYICAQASDPHAPAVYIIKPYVEFLDRAHGDPKLTKLLNDAELSIADGVAVLWAAHYLYAGPRNFSRFIATLAQIMFAPAKLAWPIPERAAGTNFTWPLLEAAARAKLRVYLIGKETPEAIQHTADTISRAIPGLTTCGTTCGRDPDSKRGAVTAEWTKATAKAVQEARADLILVGMGFPLQEQVCAELAQAVHHGVFIGEGGTFDYESFGGTRPKAPARIQKLGLEWLWRLGHEPSRFKRQLAIPRFIARVWQTRR